MNITAWDKKETLYTIYTKEDMKPPCLFRVLLLLECLESSWRSLITPPPPPPNLLK